MGLSLIAFIFLMIYIKISRKKYNHIYCPFYSDFLLAHLSEVIKAKGNISHLMLNWSEESGDDIFVLFSSWRVHIHVVDTNKIKQILGSSSWLKPAANLISNFCGVPILGPTSLFTEPGTKIWTKK